MSERKYIVILKDFYLRKRIIIKCNGKKLDSRHCFLMSNSQIDKLNGYFNAVHPDTLKERERQTKIGQSDNYTMQFFDILESDNITYEIG